MKLRLPKLLKKVLLSCFIAVSAATTIASGAVSTENPLGDILFVGDSITQGAGSGIGPGYRYQFFKNVVDNGGIYKPVGDHSTAGGVTPSYGGVIFDQANSGHSAWWSGDLAGVGHTEQGSSSTSANTGGISGLPTWLQNYTPDTVYIMAGTNDFLHNNRAGNFTYTDASGQKVTIAATAENIAAYTLYNLEKMIVDLKADNPNAVIYIGAIPLNSNNGQMVGGTEAYNVAIERVNSVMRDKDSADDRYKFVDSMRGIRGKTAADSAFAFGDAIHPNAHGELIMAGNLARTMGTGQRSAQQTRKGAADAAFTRMTTPLPGAGSGWTQNGGMYELSTSTKSTWLQSWSGSQSTGFTCEVSLQMYSISANSGNCFSIQMGNGTLGNGTLNIYQDRITWGTTTLYINDNTAQVNDFRIAYINSAATGLTSGYYIWMNGILIGEARAASGSSTLYNGVILGSLTGGSSYAGVTNISLSGNQSLAPKYTTNTDDFGSAKLGGFNTLTPQAAAPQDAQPPVTVGDIYGQGTGSNSAYMISKKLQIAGAEYGSQAFKGLFPTDASGNLSITFDPSSGLASSYTESPYLANAVYKTSVIGLLQQAVTANLTLNFNSPNVKVGGGSVLAEGSAPGGSILGYWSLSGYQNYTGNITMNFSAGEFGDTVHSQTDFNGYRVLRGFVVAGGQAGGGRTGNIVGNTTVAVTGGTFYNGIIGGGGYGDVSGNTNISILGGTIGDSKWNFASLFGGAGATGNVGGNTNITIGGATQAFGITVWNDVYGGSCMAGNVVGSSNIFLDGASTQFIDIRGNIYGGSKGTGTVASSNITLQNFTVEDTAKILSAVISGNGTGAGAVSGTKNLNLKNIQGTLSSSLRGFDVVNVDGASNVKLSSTTSTGLGTVNVASSGRLGLEAMSIVSLNLAQAAQLDLNGALSTTGAVTFAGNNVLSFNGNSQIASADAISLTGGTLTINLSVETVANNQIFTLMAGTSLSMLLDNVTVNISSGVGRNVITGRLLRAGDNGYDASKLQYIILSGGRDAATLTWTGLNTTDGRTWAVGQTAIPSNWNEDQQYYNGDIVHFGLAGAGTVTLSGVITPQSVQVSAGTYTFTGTGIGDFDLGKPTTLSVGTADGSAASLTLLNNSTATGNLTIFAGATVVFGNNVEGASLGAWAGDIINNGTLSIKSNKGNSGWNVLVTVGKTINGTGELRNDSANATLLLTGNNSGSKLVAGPTGNLQFGTADLDGTWAGAIELAANRWITTYSTGTLHLDSISGTSGNKIIVKKGALVVGAMSLLGTIELENNTTLKGLGAGSDQVTVDVTGLNVTLGEAGGSTMSIKSLYSWTINNQTVNMLSDVDVGALGVRSGGTSTYNIAENVTLSGNSLSYSNAIVNKHGKGILFLKDGSIGIDAILTLAIADGVLRLGNVAEGAAGKVINLKLDGATSILDIGGVGTKATVFADSLVTVAGSKIQMDFNGDNADVFTLSGALTGTGTTFDLYNAGADIAEGYYLLMTTGAAIAEDMLAKFSLSGNISSGLVRQKYVLTAGNGVAGSNTNLYLHATAGTAQTLTWTGANAVAGRIWKIGQTGTPSNWTGALSGEMNQYFNGDSVIFAATGAGEVTLEGDIAPLAVSVTGGTYTFNGAAITGTATLTVASGSLTLNNDNTSTGSLSIGSGTTVNLGNGGTAGMWAGAIANAGTLVLNQSGSYTVAGAISGAGAIQIAAGAASLGDLSGFTGGLSLQDGVTLVSVQGAEQLVVNLAGINGTLGVAGGDKIQLKALNAWTSNAGHTVTILSDVDVASLGTRDGGATIYNTAENAKLAANVLAYNNSVVTKQGKGTLFLRDDALGQDYTLTLAIADGILRLGNVAVGAAAKVINLKLDGATSILDIGGVGTKATVFADSLVTVAGSQIQLDFNGANADVFTLSGSLAGTGTTFDLHNLGGDVAAGYYLLMTTGSTITTEMLAKLSLSGVANLGRKKYELKVGNGSSDTGDTNLYLYTNQGVAQTLTWTGVKGNEWSAGQTGTPTNWTGAVDGEENQYWQGDSIVFGAAGAGTILLSGEITPSNVTVSGGTYVFEGSGIGDFNMQATALTVTGLSTSLTLQNVNTATGVLTIASGATVTLAGIAGTWAASVVNEGVLVFDHTASFSFAQEMSGSGMLVKNGVESLTLSQENSYEGGTIFNLGNLIAGHVSAFGVGDVSLTVNAGTLDLGEFAVENTLTSAAIAGILTGATAFVGDLSITGGILTLGSDLGGTAAESISMAGGSLNMSTFNSDRSIDVTASGTLTAANFTGTLSITGGTLTLGSDLGGTAAESISMAGGSLNMSTFDSARSIDVIDSGTLTAANFMGALSITGGTLTLGSDLGGTAAESISMDGGNLNMSTFNSARGIDVTGSGTLTATNFTGALSITNGTLTLGTALGSGSSIALKGGTLDMNGFNAGRDIYVSGTTAALFGTGSFVGNIVLENESVLTSVLNVQAQQTLIVGSAIGHQATLSGGLTMNGGTLSLFVDFDSPSSLLTIQGDLNIAGASFLNIELFSGSLVGGEDYLLLSYTGTLTGNLASWTPQINVGRTIFGLKDNNKEIFLYITSTDSLNWTGSGNSTWEQVSGNIDDREYDPVSPWGLASTPIAGDNHFYANDAVAFKGEGEGTVTISGLVSPSSIVVSAGVYIFENAVNSSIIGAGALTVSGGSLTLNSSNSSRTGVSSLKGGSLMLGHAEALGQGVLTYKAGSLGIAQGVNYALTDANFALEHDVTTMDIVLVGGLNIASSAAVLGLNELNVGATSNGGTLDLGNAVTSITLGIASSANITLAGAVQMTGITNINGTVTTNSNVGGTVNLKSGGKLNLGAEMTSTVNVSGASTLNKQTGDWKSLKLASDAVLNYQEGNVSSALTLGSGKLLTVSAGASLSNGLTLDGGSLVLDMDGVVTTGSTVFTLQSGNLMTQSATSITLDHLILTARGEYTFNLIAGAGALSEVNLDLLSLQGLDYLNLLSTPTLSFANGNLQLVLNIAASLEWSGQINQYWSNDVSDTNWLYQGGLSAFREHDFVVFNDNAVNKDVELVADVTIGALRPTTMTVDTTQSYTFSGKGNIMATGKLIKLGQGSLIFTNEGVNTFLAGMFLEAGNVEVSGAASLVGDLSLGSELVISSSALSALSQVSGVGSMVINGTGGATLSGLQGSYTGAVTVNQGVLHNNDVIGDKKLTITASGNVTLTGITDTHLQSLTTTRAGVTISGLSGSITTANSVFVLSAATSNTEVIHFGDTGGSLDMGSLTLKLDTSLLDPTAKHKFVITNGLFGVDLSQRDNFGKYTNFTIDGSVTDQYFVLDIQGGAVIIGGTKIYENFVLDVNNQWTPHITDKQAAEFTASEFKANATTQFKTVTVDGVLKLIGKDAFELNSLSGASTGWIGMMEGADVRINGTGTTYHGSFSAGASHVTFAGNQTMTGRLALGELTIASGGHLTVGSLASVANNLTLESDATLTVNLGAEVSVAKSVTLASGARIDGEGTLTIAQGGTLTLQNNAALGGELILNLIAKSAGGSGDAGVVHVGNNTITIGGLTGTGKLETDTQGRVRLNVAAGESLSFSGSLTSVSKEGGSIIKMGEGTQTLAAKTNKDQLYGIDVQQGKLIVEANPGQSSASYGSIMVGGTMNKSSFALRSMEPQLTSVSPSAIFAVHTSMTAENVTVNNGGLLVIGGNLINASLTVTGAVNFNSGSALEMYIGNTGDKAMISVTGEANTISGLGQLDSLKLHAAISWQAYVKAILFQSKNEIVGTIDPSKIIMDGFGNQTVTKGDDNKTIIFEASRSLDNNPFSGLVSGQNALAGLDLIWSTNVEAGKQKENIDANSELGTVFNSIVLTGAGSAAAHQLLAAVAGSTVTALAGSQRDDFRQQQTWIRNRTVGMGISSDYVHEDLPYVNGWIQANGGSKRISSDGDEAGYNLDTFGGSVGFDVDISPKFTWGFAFTANYNKLTASGAESAKGRNDAYYANLFLRVQDKKWGHTAIITGGWNDAKLDRTVSGVGVNYVAKGTTQGSTIGAMYEATYDYTLNENKTSILQPLFNVSFASASMDAYTEQGAGNAGLQVDGTDSTYGSVALGARLLGTVGENLFGRSSMGELRLQVAQDFGDDTHLAQVGLGGIQRQVVGTKVGKTALQIGAGISIPVTEKGSIYFDVNTDFRSKATDVNGSVGYRVNF